MGFIELILIAVGLSMDAFAVSICKGLGMRKLNYKQALIIALFFGGFQAIMPLIGWALGVQFQHYIESIDHWIAFALLAFIGGKMLWDALREGPEVPCSSASSAVEQGSDPLDLLDSSKTTSVLTTEEANDGKLNLRELFMLAIATSIDALAVGITFAFLQVDIVPAVTSIGLITFCLAFIGVVAGNRFGAKYEKPATIIGGVVLILIGLKILLEHLGILG